MIRDGTRRTRLSAALMLLLAVVITALGCGGSGTGDGAAAGRGGAESVAAEALEAALEGDGERFKELVAVSFLEAARREMPDVEDQVLGSILIAGFMEDLPFAGIENAVYQADVNGDKAVVHVWGGFVDAGGQQVILEEAEAVRVPLVKENGRWYLDLLDI